MIGKIAQFLKFLSNFKLVHGDLRPANVLPVFENFNVVDVKVKDFTNSFKIYQIGEVEPENAEYCPPEINDLM